MKISVINCVAIVVGFAGMIVALSWDNPNVLLVLYFATFFMINVLRVFAQTATQFYELISGNKAGAEADDDPSVTI